MTTCSACWEYRDRGRHDLAERLSAPSRLQDDLLRRPPPLNTSPSTQVRQSIIFSGHNSKVALKRCENAIFLLIFFPFLSFISSLSILFFLCFEVGFLNTAVAL